MSPKFSVVSTVSSISLTGVPYTPGSGEPALQTGQTACPAEYQDQLRELINLERQSPLLFNAKLQWAAQAQTIEAAAAQDETRAGFKDRIVQAGFFGDSFDGVILHGPASPAEAVSQWAAESRSACFSPMYLKHRYGGGGCVIDSAGSLWFTLAFSE